MLAHLLLFCSVEYESVGSIAHNLGLLRLLLLLRLVVLLVATATTTSTSG